MNFKNFNSKNDKEIEQMIRVNQAGEFGAKRIYDDQLAVLKNNKKYEMMVNEFYLKNIINIRKL